MPASRFHRMAAAICRSLWARRMLLLPSACLQLDSAVWLPPYAAPYGRGACFFCPHAYSSIPPYGCRHMPLPVSAAHASSSVRMPTARFRCFAASSRCGAVAICRETSTAVSRQACTAPAVSRRMRTSLLQRVAGRILRLGRFLRVSLLPFL